MIYRLPLNSLVDANKDVDACRDREGMTTFSHKSLMGVVCFDCKERQFQLVSREIYSPNFIQILTKFNFYQ